ncbi:MAG TPA: LysM peptidoglycan-binding domain-containing protein [Clostridia bacterium]|nr:LysM peptidoglycan-binding domain-containing protein [Clostridia bacterium]
MRKTIIAFLAALAVALTSSATASAAGTYVVQPGDSLFFIAQRYNISLNNLQAANSLHNTTIYPGQVLTIPGGSNSYYTVQPGDTLFIIAQKYGINYSQLQQANNLSTSQIYPGQRLVIPTASGGGTSYTNYRVQNGDTLYLISQRYGVSVAQIRSLNGMSGTTLYPGQNLKIPTARSGEVASRGGFSWRDMDLLAKIVNGEARGEPYLGQVAVAAVVLNRLRSPAFPNTIAGVIYQPGAFTAVSDGQINAPLTSSAVQAARAAVNGWDPTYGALYYWNPVTATNKWVWSRPIILRIGNHVFAK